jgi:hypothetical protein
LILTACLDESKKSQSGYKQTDVNYDSTRTTIIPWNFDYVFDSLNYKPASLSKSDIDEIDVSFVATVADYNNSLSPEHDEYRIDLNKVEYRKQLVAVVNSKGEKEVWVNCFCGNSSESWRTKIVVVFDGGPCYFNFKLNLTTKKVYQLSVNGVV